MDIHSERITKSPEETQAFGRFFSDTLLEKQRRGDLNGPIIMCLYGQLGSGKTTFAQGVLRGLGIEGRILSPTFTIVRRYVSVPLHRDVFHIDWYRLTREEDIMGLGFQDIFSDPSVFAIVEWADRLGAILPDRRVDVRFTASTDGSHSISVINDSYGCI
jgi:tRNA threonylcarbamoyladenosine biosynthesis protein TsaE